MEYPSKLIEEAVNEFMKMPGIGRKTALRLVLNLVKQKKQDVRNFGNLLIRLADNIHHCKVCYNISDTEVCTICANPKRDQSLICVVEDIRDVMAIENTNHYHGVYHVLNGLISPMDGISPDDISADQLIGRLEQGNVQELIFALSATMEGDTTMFYISRKAQPHNVRISTLSRGISVGGELEYADEVTLGRSIVSRIPYSL